jgi:hypothetical protein
LKPFLGTRETTLKQIGGKSPANTRAKSARRLVSEAAGPRIHRNCNRRLTMRAHHAIAIVAAILVGFGLTLIFSSAPIAVADASVVKSVSMDISEMQQSVKSLPVEHFQDMTFVFSDGDRTNF